MNSSFSGSGSVVGSFEQGKEPSGFIKGGEFLDQVSDISFSRRTKLHVVS
jgi:hypothetical protein